jgi:hypothetical protein
MKEEQRQNTDRTEPVLKQALGPQWDSLAPVIRAHYGLTPFIEEQVQLKGMMDRVSYASYVGLLMPFLLLAGAWVPYQGQNIPAEAINQSKHERPEYFWSRTFHFPGKRPFVFRSRMLYTSAGELTEYVRFGFGLRLGVSVMNGGLVEQERGYVWKIGRWHIPLPIHLLLGKSYVEEMPISDSEYRMKWVVTHRLFGETFSYSGRFSMISKSQNDGYSDLP